MNQTRPCPVNPIFAPARVTGRLCELGQGRKDPGGPVALLTLPCPVLVTEVDYAPPRARFLSDDPAAAKSLSALVALQLFALEAASE